MGEFQLRQAAKKAAEKLADQLAEAELEIEKACMMTQISEKGQMPEEEVKVCEESAQQAQTKLAAMTKQLELKMRQADNVLKEELTSIQERSQECTTRLK